MTLLDDLKPHAHWLLRVILASVFIFHGVGKFLDLNAFSGMTGLPVYIAFLVGFAEVAGGLGIIIGAFSRHLVTRLAGLAIMPVMIGAIAMVHWPRWSFMPSESHPMGGMEFQVTLLLIACYFFLVGNRKTA